MVVAMFVGMIVLGGAATTLLGLVGVGLSDRHTDAPKLMLLYLAAHFDLRVRRAGVDQATVADLRGALLGGYDAPRGWEPRLQVLERAALLRLACVYSFRPRWSAVAAALVDDAGRPRTASGAVAAAG